MWILKKVAESKPEDQRAARLRLLLRQVVPHYTNTSAECDRACFCNEKRRQAAVEKLEQEQQERVAESLVELIAPPPASGSGNEDELDEKYGSEEFDPNFGKGSAMEIDNPVTEPSNAVTQPPDIALTTAELDDDEDFLLDEEESESDDSDTDDDIHSDDEIKEGSSGSSVAGESARAKRFVLDPTLDKIKARSELQRHNQTKQTLEQIIDGLLENVELLCEGFHTCYLESFHHKRRKFAPKEVFFAKSWRMRTHYAHLCHHHGPQALSILQQHIGLQIDAHQTALIKSLQQRHDNTHSRKISPETKKRRKSIKATKRISAINADKRLKDVQRYKETQEQKEKREANTGKKRRAAKSSASAAVDDATASLDDGPRSKKRQKQAPKAEIEYEEPSDAEDEVDADQLFSSSFGASPSSRGRTRKPSLAALLSVPDPEVEYEIE